MKISTINTVKVGLLSTLLCFFLSASLMAQGGSTEQNSKENKTRLSRVFANVATGNSFSSIGNFASIGTANNTLTASLFFLTSDYNVFNIKVSGGATNGVAAIFQEGKLNTKVGIEGSYNILLKDANNAIKYNKTDINILEREIINEEIKNQKKIMALLDDVLVKDYNKDVNTASKIKKRLVKERDSLGTVIDGLTSINDAKKKADLTSRRSKIIILIAQIDRVNIDIKKRKSDIQIDKYTTILNTYTKSHTKKIKALKKKIDDIRLKPTGSSFSWITFGYKANNDSFTLFDDSLPLEEQVSRQNYVTQGLFLSFTHQSNMKAENGEKRQRVYFSAGAKIDVTNNLSSFTEVEIVDTTVIDPTSQRVEERRQKAFSGNYVEGLTNGSIFIDYFNFISEDEPFAFHLNPILVMRENFKPVTSFQFGVLFPFKDKDKKGKIVNLELFYRINDVFNTQNNTRSIINRNTVGLQASFPFNI